MKVVYTDNAKSDIAYWRSTNNKKIQGRILALIDSIEQTPFPGIGEPEPLKHSFTGCWSRRINKEHRLIYKVENDTIVVLSLRYHYN